MKHKGKTLVLLTPGFAASESDSTCLPMQQSFVKAISELYPALNIIILSFQYPFQKKIYNWQKAEVISLGGKNKKRIWRLLLRRKAFNALKKICETNQVIGLLSFWVGECAVVGKRIGNRYKIPHYSWILGQDAREFNRYPKKLSIKGDELIALSDFLQEEFEKNHGIRPRTVITPGAALVDESRQERDIDLLGVGSLIPLKHFEIFVEAIAEIKKHRPSLKAILVGEGPEKNNLKNLIAIHRLENNIRLTGEIPHDEVLKLMQRTKILLHPSSYEGFPGVCLEALSSGAHVISFCRAMNHEIKQWHIVASREEMIRKALVILNDGSVNYQKVDFPSMTYVARQMIDQFE